MPEIKVQHQCATLDNLILAESFGEPVGDLPIQKDSCFFEKDNFFSGTWECEPGIFCLLYTSPSPRDATLSRMPSSA